MFNCPSQLRQLAQITSIRHCFYLMIYSKKGFSGGRQGQKLIQIFRHSRNVLDFLCTFKLCLKFCTCWSRNHSKRSSKMSKSALFLQLLTKKQLSVKASSNGRYVYLTFWLPSPKEFFEMSFPSIEKLTQIEWSNIKNAKN